MGARNICILKEVIGYEGYDPNSYGSEEQLTAFHHSFNATRRHLPWHEGFGFLWYHKRIDRHVLNMEDGEYLVRLFYYFVRYRQLSFIFEFFDEFHNELTSNCDDVWKWLVDGWRYFVANPFDQLDSDEKFLFFSELPHVCHSHAPIKGSQFFNFLKCSETNYGIFRITTIQRGVIQVHTLYATLTSFRRMKMGFYEMKKKL